MIRIVHELESIADSSFNFSQAIQHKYEKKLPLSPKATEDITQLIKLTKSFLQKVRSNIISYINETDLQQAYELETIINELRRSMHKEARSRMQQGSDVRSELLFLDMVKYLEHIGDNSLNIMQALNQMST